MAYIISYDLDDPGQNYGKLIERIKSYPGYAKLTESCWCVTSNSSSQDIRDDLNSVVDSNDKVFVAKLTGEAAWHGLGDENSRWLKRNLN